MSIKDELKSGVFYTFIFRYASYAVQIILSAVLARLLTPAEFGIVAVINVFVLFFLMFSTFGLGTAIIQKQDITDFEIFSLFIISSFFALIFAIAFYFGGNLIASFYNNNVYIKIARILSLSLFFNTANMVPYYLLLKERKFKTLGLSSLIIAILTGLIAIILAYKGFGYYALVYQSVLQSILTFIVYLRLTKLKIFRTN